ncbi:hypothetical protein [Enterococcus sp. DIV1224]|uniref:hypothetical protein n=1 Tax=Enterococcus sp. DIV1224 TaxID=2774845 RepID=UPI003D30178F
MITNIISITAIVILFLIVVSLSNETTIKKENHKLKIMLKDTKYAEIVDLLSDDK